MLLAALAATLVRPPATSGPFARDFEAYYAAGATWNGGGDPYTRAIWRVERAIPGVDAAHDELLPFIGPAATLPLWSLLARLPFDAARTVWLGLLALAFAALALGATWLANVPLAPARTACTLLFAALCGPVIGAYTLGQAALAGAAAVALAVVALERTSAWAIAAIALAAIQPNLAVPLLASARGRRRVMLVAAGAAVVLTATLMAGGGLPGIGTYLAHLAAHGASERDSLIQYSVSALVASSGGSPGTALAAGRASLLIALACIGATALARPNAGRNLVLLTIALLPFGVPFFHEHDFTIELIPAIVFALTGTARARTLAGFGAACAFVDWLGVAQRPHAALQTAALALAVTCAYAALAAQPDARWPAWRIPLAGAGLVLLLVPFALAHPAPVWPDALGAFHAPAALDASGVWALEQQRAGLTRAAPAWAVLRAVPLLGCVLFAAAAVLENRTAPLMR